MQLWKSNHNFDISNSKNDQAQIQDFLPECVTKVQQRVMHISFWIDMTLVLYRGGHQ
jgi:hypothetical protein